MKLFELKAISRSGNKRADGSYAVFVQELGVFGSAEKAESFMRLVIASEKEYSSFHCFVIYEKTLDRGLSGKTGSVCEFEAVRSYLADGTLYCDSPYDDGCEKPFRGRSAETIKLKVGNIAWRWRYDRIEPVLVADLPLTCAECRKIAEERGSEPALDYSDDAYTVYACNTGHEHPECWRCLPYYGGISQRVLKRLYACREREEREIRRRMERCAK